MFHKLGRTPHEEGGGGQVNIYLILSQNLIDYSAAGVLRVGGGGGGRGSKSLKH